MRLPNGLNPRQQAFVLAYLTCLNATQAAIEAGYSPKTAQEQGSQLLSNLMVREVVRGVQEKALERAEATVQRIIAEYVALAFFDPATMFSPSGEFLNIHDMPQSARRCLSAIEVEESFEGRGEERRQVGVLRKIRFMQKTEALKALGTHLKMFVDNQSSDPVRVNVNVLVSPEDATRIIGSLVGRAQLSNGNGGNGGNDHSVG